jgi:hypothetical protein
MIIITLLIFWLLGWYLSCWLEYNFRKKYYNFAITLFLLIFWLPYISIILLSRLPLDIEKTMIKSFEYLNSIFWINNE